MFWLLPAGLFATSLAVYKFGYLAKVQVALDLLSAEQVVNIKELARLLKTKGGAIYAIISGVVTTDKPILCTSSMDSKAGVNAVYCARKVVRLFEEWSRTSRRWESAQQRVAFSVQETPFSVSDATGSIAVLKDEALAVPLIAIFEKFDRAPSSSSLATNIIEKLVLDVREVGTKTEELALPVGTHVYAIGEAVLDKATGKIVLRNPGLSGKPFMISQTQLSGLVARVRGSARVQWWLAVSLFSLSAALVVYKAYMIWKKRRDSMPEEEYTGERKCCICLNKESTVIFLPCGHVCSCPDCSAANVTCPICRARIQSRREIVFS